MTRDSVCVFVNSRVTYGACINIPVSLWGSELWRIYKQPPHLVDYLCINLSHALSLTDSPCAFALWLVWVVLKIKFHQLNQVHWDSVLSTRRPIKSWKGMQSTPMTQGRSKCQAADKLVQCYAHKRRMQIQTAYLKCLLLFKENDFWIANLTAG